MRLFQDVRAEGKGQEMGKRLIYAELLTKKFLTRYTEREKQGNYTFVACEIKQDFADLMDEIPTVDAVEVVRCKDCKYYHLSRLECHNKYMNGIIGVDGFCSYGERRSDETD